jgi:hypothetical protein
MTCDINGYSWGYASALYDAGVRCLLSAVHTHHGYTVCSKKQFPFYWEGPDGKKLLVWQGEHYHLGNELNIHRLSGQYSYMIPDGLPGTGLSDWELTKTRLFAYVRQLKKEGYPFDFCPIQVSGMCTDNSPPGPQIAQFVEDWNREFKNEIEMEMVTLRTFFDEVEKHTAEIPTYRGDWTDWWADGVCSTPNVVKHYREAVRKYQNCRLLDPDYKIVDQKLLDSARYDLMMYAEHTWGFSSSITEPSHPQVNTLDQRKTLFAARAHESVSRCQDQLCEHFGETAVILWKDYRIRVVNPTNHQLQAIARTDLESLYGYRNIRLIEEKTGKEVPCQISYVARGYEFNIPVTLEPLEAKSFLIQEAKPGEVCSVSMHPDYGADGIHDFAFARYADPDWACTPFEMDTPFFKIRFEVPTGIVSIYDKKHQRELINGQKESAFQPIYEITPILTDAYTERRRMGRNRKAQHTKRDFATLTRVDTQDFGSVFMRASLQFELSGCKKTELILTAYRDLPRLDIDFRLHKESCLEPENLYLALPFAKEESTLYVEKTGCILRPRLDQLPESCTEFYALQSGLAWIQKDSSVILALPDAPMISMGSLLPHDIRLCGDPLQKNSDPVYSWVMNNFWETNFKASLGGFHQYSYSLRISDTTDPVECLRLASDDCTGALAFTSFDLEKANPS